MKHLIAATALWLCCVVAAPVSAEVRNPFESDEAAIRIGNALFANRCALCHGSDAKGSLGPDLTLRWARGEQRRADRDGRGVVLERISLFGERAPRGAVATE